MYAAQTPTNQTNLSSVQVTPGEKSVNAPITSHTPSRCKSPLRFLKKKENVQRMSGKLANIDTGKSQG